MSIYVVGSGRPKSTEARNVRDAAVLAHLARSGSVAATARAFKIDRVLVGIIKKRAEGHAA